MANKDITETGVQEVLRTMGIPSSFKGFREDVTGRAEALATVGSGMAGTMAGMGGGLFEMLRSGNPQAALDQYRQIQEAMTFVPRTQKGLENVQDIGEFFQPVANIYEQFGEGVAEQTGSPVVGEFAQEFVDPLDLIGLGAVSAIPAIAKAAKKSKPSAPKADPKVAVDVDIPEAELDAIEDQTLKLYHGSPYDFNAFDPEKALTGEGAQAYGYGAAYTSFEPNVGRRYRGNRDNQGIDKINKQLKEILREKKQYETGEYGVYSDPKGYELRDQYESLLDKRQALVENDPDIRVSDKPILDVYNNLTGPRATDADYQKAEIIEQIMIDGDVLGVVQRQADYGEYDPEIYKWFEEEVAPNFSRKGVLYELNVKTSKENLLDFDKPVKDQPEKVKQALLDSGIKEDTAGRFAYYGLAPKAKGLGAQREATEAAQKLGIDGIIYEDPHSPAGTKNVVVFDARIIEIAKKYGVAIPIAAKILEQAEESKDEPPES